MPKGQSEGDENVVAEDIVKRVASSVTTVVMLDPSDVLLNLEDTLNGCRGWLSRVVVEGGCRGWLSRVAVEGGCRGWLPRMVTGSASREKAFESLLKVF
jgi:hypothetical protein